MKNQITILITSILAIAPATLAMNPTGQEELNKALFAAIQSGDFAEEANPSSLVFTIKPKSSFAPEVERLLNEGADPNAREENIGWKDSKKTCLQIAAMRGHESACKLLLEHNANVDATDRFGHTALMLATRHTNVCKLLLAHGAQVNAVAEIKGYGRFSALYYASRINVETCVLLLEHNADPTIQCGQYNDTPLTCAANGYNSCNKTTSLNTCIAIVNFQKQTNLAIRTTLLCLNRLRKKQPFSVLYREFKTLLLPYIGRYIPLMKLLGMRTSDGKNAYDYLQIFCLNPHNINHIYAQSDITKHHEQVRQSWFSDCSFQ